MHTNTYIHLHFSTYIHLFQCNVYKYICAYIDTDMKIYVNINIYINISFLITGEGEFGNFINIICPC